jgi:hypothetical protein
LRVKYVTTDLDTDLIATGLGVYQKWWLLNQNSYTLQSNSVKGRFRPKDVINTTLDPWTSRVGRWKPPCRPAVPGPPTPEACPKHLNSIDLAKWDESEYSPD